MHEHDCRPTLTGYFFKPKNRACTCRHCGKSLRLTNGWLPFVCNLIVVLPALYIAHQRGLSAWQPLLILIAAAMLLNLCSFPLYRFEVDLSAEKDKHSRDLQR